MISQGFLRSPKDKEGYHMKKRTLVDYMKSEDSTQEEKKSFNDLMKFLEKDIFTEKLSLNEKIFSQSQKNSES